MPERIMGTVKSDAEREIVLSRVFDAPRKMVWEAWTDPARVTMRLVFASPQARDRNVREYGSIEGGKQTLERLAEYLSLQLSRQTHGGVR